MIDPTGASESKKVMRYVNTASNIQLPSDKLPNNSAPQQDKAKIDAKVTPPSS